MTKSKQGISTAEQSANKDSGEALQQILSRVDARQGAPDEVKQRIKHNVKTQWRVSVSQNTARQTWWVWGSLATACSIAAVFWLNSLFLPAQIMLNNVQIHRTQGQVKLVSADGLEHVAQSLDVLVFGSRLDTLTDGLVVLTFNSGGNLRLNKGTSVSFNGENEFTLNHGTVYFDSGSALNRRTKVTLHTRFGDIQNLGTQFAVSSEADQLSVWVREGSVNLAHGGMAHMLEQGEKLLTNGASEPTISAVKSTDPVWQWVNEVAPEFELEGKNLNQFLLWLTREHGLALEYDSPETRNMAHVIILHGGLDDLNMAQSLETVFATVDLHYVLQQDKLLVYK